MSSLNQTPMSTPYISVSELDMLMRQKSGEVPAMSSSGEPEKFEIIDVRDEDRYDGWIPGSRHCGSTQFGQIHLPKLLEEYYDKDVTLIFHCMFSQSRGPRCARIFADSCDKQQNLNANSNSSEGTSTAPKCRIRILKGGYATYEQEFPTKVTYSGDERTEGPKNQYIYKDSEE